MTIRLKLASALRSAVVFSSIIAIVPATAQSSERNGASAQPAVLGPATPRSGAADLSCGAGPAGLVLWSADVVEQALSLDDIQRAKFNGLKAASQRAIEYLNESCPKTHVGGNLKTLAADFEASRRSTAAKAFSL
jgi:hypothetical protein